LTSGLTVEDVQMWPSILEAVTEEQILAAAQSLLDLNTSVTGYLTNPSAEEATQ